MPTLTTLDHLVLTVSDLDRTVDFYLDVLGMQVEEFMPADGSRRTALKFGAQKINLHVVGAEFKPNAKDASVGSADFCFLSDTLLSTWQAHLIEHDVPVEQGPIARTGATGCIWSIYIRDPDGNLLEISNPA